MLPNTPCMKPSFLSYPTTHVLSFTVYRLLPARAMHPTSNDDILPIVGIVKGDRPTSAGDIANVLLNITSN